MTQEFSFKYYINNYINKETEKFNEYFRNKIENIPEKTISSKEMIKRLNIDNNLEKLIFKNVFLKYFKEKLIKDLK